MKTCGECKELDCSGFDEHPDAVACDDFTSEAIREETVIVTPTPEQYRRLLGEFDERGDVIHQLETRLTGYEHAVAELVRFAQNDLTP